MQLAPRMIAPHWTRSDGASAPEDASLTYTIALQGANFSQLSVRMQEIAQDGSGGWLSPAELAAYASPDPAHVEHLLHTLNASGIPSSAQAWSEHQDRVKVTATVGQTQRLFPGSHPFRRFSRSGGPRSPSSAASRSLHSGRIHIRTTGLAIPQNLDYVQHVAGLTDFDPVRRSPSATAHAFPPSAPDSRNGSIHANETEAFARPTIMAAASAPSGCGNNGSSIDATCIQSTYGSSGYTPKGGAGLDVLIVGYTETYVDLNDVSTYLSKYSSVKTSNTGQAVHLLDGISGANDAAQPSLEASLDTQMVAGQNFGLNNTYLYYEETGSTFAESMNYVLDTPSLNPGVISVSFTAPEDAFSPSEATYLCNTIQKLTAQGTTVVCVPAFIPPRIRLAHINVRNIFSLYAPYNVDVYQTAMLTPFFPTPHTAFAHLESFSANSFSAGDGGVDSVNGTTACPNGQFLPTYPSGCPYVLSVGGTVDPSEEWAASWSGGGFSNLFGIPSYQKDAVSGYINALGHTVEGRFNTSGRAYPDVSALGTPISVIQGGKQVDAFGTSASAPIWAAFISLLNDARQAEGKGRVGYIHPALYNNSAALRDIQAGQNYGCNASGFAAAVGWDPVSGLGAPNFTSLMQVLGTQLS